MANILRGKIADPSRACFSDDPRSTDTSREREQPPRALPYRETVKKLITTLPCYTSKLS